MSLLVWNKVEQSDNLLNWRDILDSASVLFAFYWFFLAKIGHGMLKVDRTLSLVLKKYFFIKKEDKIGFYVFWTEDLSNFIYYRTPEEELLLFKSRTLRILAKRYLEVVSVDFVDNILGGAVKLFFLSMNGCKLKQWSSKLVFKQITLREWLFLWPGSIKKLMSYCAESILIGHKFPASFTRSPSRCY